MARLLEVLWRLFLLPFKLAFALLGTTFRAGAAVGAAPVRLTWAATRRAGWTGVGCFALGLAVGVLLAPTSGSQLRARLLGVLLGDRPADPELTQRVVHELAHAPRTWHLDQPSVEVVDGAVLLRGEVAHDVARDELERTAAAVPGVVEVRSELSVAPDAG